MQTFYGPEDGVAADFIPFFWKGDYHLFYLKDYRNVEHHGEGTPWFHLVTRDFVLFEDWGEALSRGGPEDQDLYVFTGSVIEKDGLFTIYYTGHNPHFYEAGKPVQAILRATSPDLRTWTKDPTFQFFAPDGYEPHDWRDPFVFWDERAGEYRMLITARETDGPSRRRGCFVVAGSPDMQEWLVRENFWTPHMHPTQECPDLFRIGEWWYLIYSDYMVTEYRMSRSADGPWMIPADPTLDGRAYYAAKSAGDGQQRFLFGWLSTREGMKDEGN
ncbi:MAG: hypothetical protein M3Y56_17115 [Armatimonadota bacterium]|nr:hypothetical protein [Armatimonadota bacterium]